MKLSLRYPKARAKYRRRWQSKSGLRSPPADQRHTVLLNTIHFSGTLLSMANTRTNGPELGDGFTQIVPSLFLSVVPPAKVGMKLGGQPSCGGSAKTGATANTRSINANTKKIEFFFMVFPFSLWPSLVYT